MSQMQDFVRMTVDEEAARLFFMMTVDEEDPRLCHNEGRLKRHKTLSR